MVETESFSFDGDNARDVLYKLGVKGCSKSNRRREGRAVIGKAVKTFQSKKLMNEGGIGVVGS